MDRENQLNDPSNNIENNEVETEREVETDPILSYSTSWQKLKKCLKICCCLSILSIVIGLISFTIAMGIALSRLNEGNMCLKLFSAIIYIYINKISHIYIR